MRIMVKKVIMMFAAISMTVNVVGQNGNAIVKAEIEKSKASNKNFKSAMELFNEGDRVMCLPSFILASDEGVRLANTYIGYIYQKDKNYPLAVTFFEIGAKEGEMMAQYCLGTCYYKGEGLSKDYKKAVEWFTESATQGYDQAQYALGLCYKEADSNTEALKWFKKAAEQGYAKAQFEVGEYYMDSENTSEGIKWLRKAAENKHAEAAYTLAQVYMLGEGVPANETEGKKWLETAAKLGHADAKELLNVP